MPSKIPDRWLNYKPCGLVIEGTRIICFKVPLKSNVGRPPSATWTVTTLLADIPDLVAVIDLTNTHRYYNSKDLVSAGVEHKKILMKGRVIPPEKKVSEFMASMDIFLAKDNCSLVGVHCTHGLNRTGYMVCRYMRDRLGIPIREAIKRFEFARGYRMERQNLIGHLLNCPPCPPCYGGETTIVPVNQGKRRRCKD